MKLLQSSPTLSSPAGILTLIVGTAIAIYVLSQFEFTRRLTGLSDKGKLQVAG